MPSDRHAQWLALMWLSKVNYSQLFWNWKWCFLLPSDPGRCSHLQNGIDLVGFRVCSSLLGRLNPCLKECFLLLCTIYYQQTKNTKSAFPIKSRSQILITSPLITSFWKLVFVVDCGYALASQGHFVHLGENLVLCSSWFYRTAGFVAVGCWNLQLSHIDQWAKEKAI